MAAATNSAAGRPPAETAGAREATGGDLRTPEHGRVRLSPTWRMLAVAAFLLVPAALAELFAREAAVVLLLLAIAIALAAIVDATLGLGRAGAIGVRALPLIRLALGREAALEIELRAERGTPGRLRVGIAAPAQLGIDEAELEVAAPGEAAAVRCTWRVRPRRRGIYRLERLHAERRSPLGWWAVRWPLAMQTEVRVYPNLLTEGRRLAAFFLHKPALGWRNQRQLGRGREFEKLREYLPGDGFDEIHWKATAKRGHPVTKVFQVERTQEIYAVVDASRLSGRPVSGAAMENPVSPAGRSTGERTDDNLLERQINAALALVLAAERQGDLFGLATYADRPRDFVRARSGAAHFQACREALVSLQPQPLSPDFREVCTFLRARLTKRALLVFFSSLDDPALADAFVEAVTLVARRHLVLVVTPLPDDAQPLFSGAAPDSVAGVYARLGGHLRWQGLQDLGARLHPHGVRLALLNRSELAAGAVSHYMALKQRQLI